MTLRLDNNSRELPVREGDAVGGFLEYTGTALTAAQWYRLMPHGNTAAIVDGNNRQLTIGALRDDLLRIDGWQLEILNKGYYSKNLIKSYGDSIVTLEAPIHFRDGLPTNVEWVMFPKLDFPLHITYFSSNTSRLIDIGFARETEMYTPTTIKKLTHLSDDRYVSIPVENIHKVFFRFPLLVDTETYQLSWGEHRVSS